MNQNFLGQMRAKLNRLLAIVLPSNTDNLKKKLIKGSLGSFGVSLAALGLGFAISLLLSNLLGAEGFGIYSYGMAWYALLSIPATIGLNILLIRNVAVYKAESQWGLLRGLLRWSNLVVFFFSIALALVGIFLVYQFVPSSNWQIRIALSIALATVPIGALKTLRLSAMKGLQEIVLGQLPEQVLAPILFILFIICGSMILGTQFNAPWVVGLNWVAVAISFIVGWCLLRWKLPEEIDKVKPEYLPWQWLKAALPFMSVVGSRVVYSRADIIMLGILVNPASVGIYAIVTRLANLITSFIMNPANAALTPAIADLYVKGEQKKLQRVLTRNAQIMTLGSFAAMIVIVISAKWILMFFGEDFVQGRNALFILCAGQLVNALTGPVGWVLNMTGYEKYTMTTFICGMTLNILLNAVLIPIWGINGAAAATSVSKITVSVVNTIWVFRLLHLNVTVIKF